MALSKQVKSLGNALAVSSVSAYTQAIAFGSGKPSRISYSTSYTQYPAASIVSFTMPSCRSVIAVTLNLR
jgi:hypothetical protein